MRKARSKTTKNEALTKTKLWQHCSTFYVEIECRQKNNVLLNAARPVFIIFQYNRIAKLRERYKVFRTVRPNDSCAFYTIQLATTYIA